MGTLTRRTRPASQGFTLIEVLVVVLIITIMIGAAALRLTRGPQDTVREEAQRLAMLLQAARQEAVLQGQPIGFATTADGYLFLRPDSRGRLQPLNDETFRNRLFAPGVHLVSLGIDGAGDSPQDGMILPPSGELPGFAILLAAGEAHWYVIGYPDGQIRAQAQRDTPSG